MLFKWGHSNLCISLNPNEVCQSGILQVKPGHLLSTVFFRLHIMHPIYNKCAKFFMLAKFFGMVFIFFWLPFLSVAALPSRPYLPFLPVKKIWRWCLLKNRVHPQLLENSQSTLMEEWRGWCATSTIWAITAHPTSPFIRTAHKSQLGIF